jgi:hypothetical protein
MRRAPGLLLAAALVAAACSGNSEPHGSPVLLGVYWIAGNQSTPVWTMVKPTQGPPVAGNAQEVDFVFDRLLDGARIEDDATVDGVPTTIPKAMPPITVGWADSATAMSTPPFADQVRYNSEPLYGGTTAFVLLQPTVVGFPSADTVVFTLDKTGLTSAYGDQMTGPAQISVATAPLSASFLFPTGTDGGAAIPSNYQLPIVFSNRVGGAAAVSPFVQVTARGAALPIALAADASDPTVVYLSPAGCLAGWPSGVTIDVSVGVGVTDAFGVVLAKPATTSFTATGAPDGGCGTPDSGMPDGGAGDGGAPDGGARD